MKSLIQNFMLSILVTVWVIPSYAQETEKKPVSEAVYQEYKENGVDKAIETYHKLKKDHADEYVFDEFQLNSIGYKIMNEDKDPQTAKKIFLLNMEEYPQAVNPNDSYADVLVRLGEKEEAKKYYHKAIETFEKKGISDRSVARNAKAKLAALDNKHQNLDFLEGSWASTNTFWNEQNEERKENGQVSFTYFNDLVLVGEMKPEARENEEIPGYVWLVTYNAQDDAYETAWVGPGLRGLSDQSKLQVESNEGGKYVLKEEFEYDENNYITRHEIEPRGNTLQWIVYESKNGEDFKKVAQHDMTRNQLDITKK